MVAGGKIQEKVDKFLSKILQCNMVKQALTPRLPHPSETLSIATLNQCSHPTQYLQQIVLVSSSDYLIMHLNGHMEYRESTNSMLAYAALMTDPAATPLPLAVNLLCFHDPRMTSLDSVLSSGPVMHMIHRFLPKSSLTSVSVGLSFPWLRDLLVNLLLHQLPDTSLLHFLSEDQVHPFAEWAKLWPSMYESIAEEGKQVGRTTIGKKRSHRQFLDSISLGLTSTLAYSDPLQHFLSSHLHHLDGIPSHRYVNDVVPRVSQVSNWFPPAIKRFKRNKYCHNWQAVKGYSLSVDRFDYNEHLALNDHIFQSDRQVVGGGNESTVLSAHSQWRHK